MPAFDFIIIHSDISDKYTRDCFRERLKDREGAEMLSESVYFMPYSESAIAAARYLAQTENVQILPLMVTLPAEQKEILHSRYENAFSSHFDDLEESLSFIERIITGEVLYHDKKTNEKRQYDVKQIKTRLNDADTDIRSLEGRIIKRKQREANIDLSALEFKLRALKLVHRKINENLVKAIKARNADKQAEGNQKLDSGQGQGENQGQGEKQ